MKRTRMLGSPATGGRKTATISDTLRPKLNTPPHAQQLQLCFAQQLLLQVQSNGRCFSPGRHAMGSPDSESEKSWKSEDADPRGPNRGRAHPLAAAAAAASVGPLPAAGRGLSAERVGFFGGNRLAMSPFEQKQWSSKYSGSTIVSRPLRAGF